MGSHSPPGDRRARSPGEGRANIRRRRNSREWSYLTRAESTQRVGASAGSHGFAFASVSRGRACSHAASEQKYSRVARNSREMNNTARRVDASAGSHGFAFAALRSASSLARRRACEYSPKAKFPYRSPNSNNPNFVIIGDAFGFSVYFDYDRYERH